MPSLTSIAIGFCVVVALTRARPLTSTQAAIPLQGNGQVNVIYQTAGSLFGCLDATGTAQAGSTNCSTFQTDAKGGLHSQSHACFFNDSDRGQFRCPLGNNTATLFSVQDGHMAYGSNHSETVFLDIATGQIFSIETGAGKDMHAVFLTWLELEWP